VAKESGLGATLNVDDSAGTARDISNDVRDVTIATPRGVQVTTGLDVSAEERLLLLADGSVDLTGVFNDAANAGHDVFSVLDNVRTVSFALSGQTLAMEMLATDYNLTRSSSGEFTYRVPMVLADGTVPTWA